MNKRFFVLPAVVLLAVTSTAGAADSMMDRGGMAHHGTASKDKMKKGGMHQESSRGGAMKHDDMMSKDGMGKDDMAKDGIAQDGTHK